VVKCLRERGDSLAIDVRVIVIPILKASSEKEDDSPPPSSPYHLVPYLLAGLPRVILSVETVSISGNVDMPNLGRPTHGSDIFLKSYGYFQSIQTLELSIIKFDTFSYFARFITCFRALRHLDLRLVKFTKLNDYPPGPAKVKQFKLHTLAMNWVGSVEFCFVARWLLKADALSALESLSYHVPLSESTPASYGCISDMVVAAGASLKHLALTDLHGDGGTLDSSSNTSLQTIDLYGFAVNIAAFILSTISSRDLSTVKLSMVSADEVADVDALAVILVSKQFTSLPKLNRIHVQIMPTEKWRGRLAGTVEERRQIMVAEIDGPFSKLRDVFGERLEDDIFWVYPG